ncbi:MAG: hypothetical protein NZM25_05915 [Leptospiraceae bacterium]|nr:hypothetical protein [Leptospiraceae bacterium]MDW8306689.1 hypothetical protein [Leptospiraceae bacterium]
MEKRAEKHTEARASNVLGIGISKLSELEEKVKAFRTINLNAKKRRFIIAREPILDSDGKVVVNKGEEIDLAKVIYLKRHYKPDHVFKTFQPDEGIVLVSDMGTPAGVQLTMDLVTQIMNIGGGAYEAFIDRVDSFKEMSNLLTKTLFPKLAIVGYLPRERLQEEIIHFSQISRMDPYIRMIEVIHTTIKPAPVIPRLKQVIITPGDRESWARFVLEVIAEYTKNYSIEER